VGVGEELYTSKGSVCLYTHLIYYNLVVRVLFMTPFNGFL